MDKEELRVLEKIKPLKCETETVMDFVEGLVEVAKTIARPFSAEPQIVGSIAKDTFLRGDYDIDLFIVFREKVPRKSLEEHGLLIGTSITEKMGGTYNIKYAEHPYVRAKVGKYKIDIVPCYEIRKGEAIVSAVDRSPLHTRYIGEKLKGYRKDHARLMKYLCKKLGIYGADAKTEGVSGYLCELFIIQFGTFRAALEILAKTPFGGYIDAEGISSEKAARKMFRDALIVIDPTDKNRNVAAPLSAQNFMRLRLEAKRYLKTGKFPNPRHPARNLLIEKLQEDRGTTFTGLRFDPPDIIAENLYPQLRRLEGKLVRYLGENDFPVVRHHSWTDEKENAYVIVEVERHALSKYKRQEGPDIFSGEVGNFLKKYLDNKYKPYIEKGRFFVCAKRRFLNVETAIRAFLKERFEEIPKSIAEKDIRVMDGGEIAKIVNGNNALNASIVRRVFSV
ncbi:MAG: CCA tRNA nucleotidyltransferase [Candidatus Aenigmatarchaeota archaeon]